MDVAFRDAREDDLPALVALLADDPLGATREEATDPLPPAYRDAFAAIAADANQRLVVAELDGAVVGTLQISYLPNLSHRGSWRAQIEGVRVARGDRGGGVGRRMVEWAVERARERGCRLVQLTTDRRRPDARAFYERLGFEATHDGMKLLLR